MNLKIIFLCINTVTAVTAHNHLRHKPEQNQITSFQNTKGELSRLLLLKGSETERLLSSGDLGDSCDDNDDCGKDMECGSKDKCVCDKKYEEVDGKCVKEDTGGSGEAGGAVAAAKTLSQEDQEVLECFDKDRVKDALDEDDEDDVEEKLLELSTTCGADLSDQGCAKICIDDIVKECKDDLKDGDEDCKDLANDFVECLEEEVADGECDLKGDGGTVGTVAAVQAAPSRTVTDQAVVDCFEEHAKDKMDEDDDKDVEDNLVALATFCGVDESHRGCVEECIEDIVKECEDDLKDSEDGAGGSKDYDDCKHLADDLIKCLEKDCYPEE